MCERLGAMQKLNSLLSGPWTWVEQSSTEPSPYHAVKTSSTHCYSRNNIFLYSVYFFKGSCIHGFMRRKFILHLWQIQDLWKRSKFLCRKLQACRMRSYKCGTRGQFESCLQQWVPSDLLHQMNLPVNWPPIQTYSTTQVVYGEAIVHRNTCILLRCMQYVSSLW